MTNTPLTPEEEHKRYLIGLGVMLMAISCVISFFIFKGPAQLGADNTKGNLKYVEAEVLSVKAEYEEYLGTRGRTRQRQVTHVEVAYEVDGKQHTLKKTYTHPNPDLSHLVVWYDPNLPSAGEVSRDPNVEPLPGESSGEVYTLNTDPEAVKQ